MKRINEKFIMEGSMGLKSPGSWITVDAREQEVRNSPGIRRSQTGMVKTQSLFIRLSPGLSDVSQSEF